MIRVKVCGLTDARNALQVAAAGPDFVGYVFYPASKRYVGEIPDPELFTNIPGKIRKAGVFVNENPDKVIDSGKRYGLDLIQLHGNETPGYCMAIRDSGFGIIKAFGIYPGFNFGRVIPYMQACDFFLFDTATSLHGGSGLRFDWDMLRHYDTGKPFFLSGGIGPGDLQKIIKLDHKALYAADINSRFETSPGIKDLTMVQAFIQDIKKDKV